MKTKLIVISAIIIFSSILTFKTVACNAVKHCYACSNLTAPCLSKNPDPLNCHLTTLLCNSPSECPRP